MTDHAATEPQAEQPDAAKPQRSGPPSHWKSRLAIAIIMLTLTFIGIVIAWIEPIAAMSSWYYWVGMAVLFALMSVGYSAYTRYHNLAREGSNLWHDVLIWIGLLIAFFVIHIIIHQGIIGRLEGGIVILNTLGLGVFCSGVVVDYIFALVGITIFIFAVCMALLTKYMAIIIVVVGVIAVLTAIYLARQGSDT